MEENQNHNDSEQNQEIKEAQAKADEYLAGWKRAQADLENFKKDEARRIQDVLKFGNERIVLEMIDVLDGLESALQHAPPDTDQSWLKGIHQAVVKFQETLKKYDVEKIESVDKPFDPSVHEALAGQGDRVKEEVRPGYMMHEKVIRPARVILGN